LRGRGRIFEFIPEFAYSVVNYGLLNTIAVNEKKNYKKFFIDFRQR
jgi:hypothetical protein